MTSSKECFQPKTSELRIMLIGRNGNDKSKVMNFLRSSDETWNPSAHRDHISIPNTEKIQRENMTIGGQKIMLVDPPGLCDDGQNDQEVMKDIQKHLSQVHPGPHAFLFVLPLDRFTTELQNMVKIFKSSFGSYVLQYTMVVFVDKGKLMEGDTIENFISKKKELTMFVNDDCKGRKHLIRVTDGQPEGKKLVQKIQEMVKANNEKHYTADEAMKWRNMALKINSCALAGAALSGLMVQLVPDKASLESGLTVGAVGGGLAGLVWCIVEERENKGGCVLS